jgi:serine/threonine-protein kinase
MTEMRPHTGPMFVGSVLGSYRIVGELSSGGMGAVFRAEHVLLGRPAAVKLLRSELTCDPDLVQRFVNEARAVTACKHPGIVEVYDFGYTPDGHAYFVMELLEGESLGRRLARVRLGEPEVAAIAQGIASALKAAHRVGVIHRDLKPDNVFLVPDPDGGIDRTKVLDFGIAKLGDGSRTGGRRTQTGILIGTPLYMAPEQARAAAAIDPRADLYSLGCIIYHMLVGRPPFLAEGAGEIIALQMFGVVEPPSRLAPVTPAMEQLVLRLLEKDPADRFDSAAEVVAALAGFDAAMTTRPTWPSGQAAPSAMTAMTAMTVMTAASDASATLSSSDDLRTGDAAALDGGPSKRTAVPELRMAGESTPGTAPGKRSTLGVVAGGIAIAALGGMLAYSLLSDGGSAPAKVESVVAPAPVANPPPAAAPAAPTATPDPARDSTPSVTPVTTPAAKPPELPETADKHGRHPHHGKPGSTKPALTDHNRSSGGKGSPASLVEGNPVGMKATPGKPGNLDVPDTAIEVIRDIRQVDPPKLGPHTSKGSPIETNIGVDRPKDPKPP